MNKTNNKYILNSDIVFSNMKPSTIRLYILLAGLKDENYELQIPYRTIRVLSGMSLAAIKQALYELKLNGLIGVYPSFDDSGAQLANIIEFFTDDCEYIHNA